LVASLVQECQLYVRPPASHPMHPAAIAVVGLAILGLAATCIALAVLPGRDPLQLSERGRTLYVYAAELVLVVLGVHVRVTMPWLFGSGLIEKYWTLIVMVVAYA